MTIERSKEIIQKMETRRNREKSNIDVAMLEKWVIR